MLSIALAHPGSNTRLAAQDTTSLPGQWTQVVVAPSTTVAVRQFGRERSPASRDTVLLLMGAQLEREAQKLSSQAVVVAMDLRGRGRSSLLPSMITHPATLQSDVEDVAAVLTHLGIGRPIMAGWSYGALVAARFSLNQPLRVRALMLLNPLSPADSVAIPALAPGDLPSPITSETFDNAAFIRCHGAFAAENAELVIQPERRRERVNLCRLRTEHPDALVHSSMPRLRSLGVYDWRSWLATSRIPTLVIGGAKDFVPGERTMWWKQHADAHVHVLDHVGHLAHVDAPERTEQLMRNFLRELRR